MVLIIMNKYLKYVLIMVLLLFIGAGFMNLYAYRVINSIRKSAFYDEEVIFVSE